MQSFKKAVARDRVIFVSGNQKEKMEFAKFSFTNLCKMFSKEAHIKEKYVRYIIISLVNVIRDLVLKGQVVKIPGLGDFYLSDERPPKGKKIIYSNLMKKYVYAGVRPDITFKPSKKLREYIKDEAIKQDAYVTDPISFSEKPSLRYLYYCIDKNNVLRQIEREYYGRTERPVPMYSPEDIDRLCLEYGISYPEFDGVKSDKELKTYRNDRFFKFILGRRMKNLYGETVNLREIDEDTLIERYRELRAKGRESDS